MCEPDDRPFALCPLLSAHHRICPTRLLARALIPVCRLVVDHPTQRLGRWHRTRRQPNSAPSATPVRDPSLPSVVGPSAPCFSPPLFPLTFGCVVPRVPRAQRIRRSESGGFGVSRSRAVATPRLRFAFSDFVVGVLGAALHRLRCTPSRVSAHLRTDRTPHGSAAVACASVRSALQHDEAQVRGDVCGTASATASGSGSGSAGSSADRCCGQWQWRRRRRLRWAVGAARRGASRGGTRGVPCTER